jgi:hypothetical protein
MRIYFKDNSEPIDCELVKISPHGTMIIAYDVIGNEIGRYLLNRIAGLEPFDNTGKPNPYDTKEPSFF